MITESDLRNILRHRIDAAGGMNRWADLHGINRAYVSLAMAGKQALGPKIIDAMGFRKKVVYFACNSEIESA